MQRPILAILSAALAIALLPSSARGAASYDSCAGFIDAVPATITTQGVWCLRRDLSTAMSSGAAIAIGTNNVTIDCNGFKLGGLAAGNASLATGIQAHDRQNISIRNCSLRGFLVGIDLAGTQGGGHVVERNRLDNNLRMGIHVRGTRNLVRENLVFDTGGSTTTGIPWAIYAAADIIGNQIDGVYPTATLSVGAVYQDDPMGTTRGNRVRNLAAAPDQTAFGLWGYGNDTSIVDNVVIATDTGATIRGNGAGARSCVGNIVAGFQHQFFCPDMAGNLPY